VDRLENVVQAYAWGSQEALAKLQGRPPSEQPEAELWMGAHPVAPSKTPRGPLDELISRAPADELGPAVVERFGPRLPFLVKLLAAAQPLSLQAHPSKEQAQAGFAREEAAKIPLADPHRSYRDANHKPELVCALSEFHALCGFRDLPTTRQVLKSLGGAALDAFWAPLEQDGLEACFKALMTARETWPSSQQAEAVAELKAATLRHGAAFPVEARWTRRLAELYPEDLAVAATLLLNHLTLEPYQAIYLPAGNLHAYLDGFAVEVMAASDNVLRGGLTPKHVDVPELLSVLRFEAGPVQVLTAHGEPEEVFDTPAGEFRLSRWLVTGKPVTPERRGPEILVCTKGEVSLGGMVFKPGDSAWVPASDGPYSLAGEGELFRATVNDP
jgi:mannose-6-phosphate isomerase